eukprot:1306757-Rhodomonas_salina.1
MEGIELEAEGFEEGMESGLSAFEVLKFKDRECAHCDVKYRYFDPLMIQSIIVCLLYFDSSTIRLIIVFLLLVLNALYWHSREYLDDDDIRLVIHYAQCMEWMHNAEFGDFHVFPPWERDIDQHNMQVEGA